MTLQLTSTSKQALLAAIQDPGAYRQVAAILDDAIAKQSRLDDVTEGTAEAGKAIVPDDNLDVSGLRNVTVTGEVASATSSTTGDSAVGGSLSVGPAATARQFLNESFTTEDGQYVTTPLLTLEDETAYAATVKVFCRQDDGAVHTLAERRVVIESTGDTVALVSAVAAPGADDDLGADITTFDTADTDQAFTTGSGAPLTAVAHGYDWNDVVRVKTSTTLPTNLAADTDYYVILVDDDTYHVSTAAVKHVVADHGYFSDQIEVAHEFALGDAVRLLGDELGDLDTTTTYYIGAPSATGFFLMTAAVSEKAAVADPGTDTFTAASHGYLVNDFVGFKEPAGTTLPAPLRTDILYVVNDKQDDTFVLTEPGGSGVLNITSAGSGAWRVYKAALADPGSTGLEDVTFYSVGSLVVPGSAGTGTHESYQLMPITLLANDTAKTLDLKVKGLAGESIKWNIAVDVLALPHEAPAA